MARLGRSQPFAPIIKRALVSGLASVTGDAAWTEANDVLAAAGSVDVAGSAAWTEGNDILAAQGSLGVFGVLAWTEGNDALAAQGTLGVFGTAAWTEGGDSLAASGTISLLPVTGDAAWTEANDNFSAAGINGNADTHDPGLRKRLKKLEERQRKQFEEERAKREARRAQVIDAFERIIDGKQPAPAAFIEDVEHVVQAQAEETRRSFDEALLEPLQNELTRLEALWNEFIERDDEEVLALL